MAYNKDTPDAITEAFSASQPKIKENFTQIKTLVDQDHETFDALNGVGKHKQLTFPAQAAQSTTSASERAIYCKNNVAGDPALWIQAADVAVAADGTDFTTSTQAASGYAVLPCGIKINWGTYTFVVGALDTAQNSGAIAFASNFTGAPFFKIASPSINIPTQTSAKNTAVYISAITANNITFTRSSSEVAMVVNFIAIGV